METPLKNAGLNLAHPMQKYTSRSIDDTHKYTTLQLNTVNKTKYTSILSIVNTTYTNTYMQSLN